MLKSFLFLKIIEPDLTVNVVNVIPSNLVGVPQNFDITFTVQLNHSQNATSDAYRVLLEIAVPHDRLHDAQIKDSAATDIVTLVNGNDAPSKNSR